MFYKPNEIPEMINKFFAANDFSPNLLNCQWLDGNEHMNAISKFIFLFFPLILFQNENEESEIKGTYKYPPDAYYESFMIAMVRLVWWIHSDAMEDKEQLFLLLKNVWMKKKNICKRRAANNENQTWSRKNKRRIPSLLSHISISHRQFSLFCCCCCCRFISTLLWTFSSV